MPDGDHSIHKFKLIESESSFNSSMKAILDPKTGQIIVEDDGKMVLQYNYQTVYEKDVIRSASENPIKPEYSPVGVDYLKQYFEANPRINNYPRRWEA